MRKILSLFFIAIFIASNCYGADITDWKRGDASIPVKGTDNISDIDTLISNYIVDPLDRLLTENIHGCTLSYATAATVTIEVGEVTCYNAAKTIRRMRRNTSTVTITLPASGASGSSLDTGNAAVSTWYHVYAVADTDVTTFTGICSASASAPTGATYFRYLGSFYNNSADDIVSFKQDGDIFYYYDLQLKTGLNNAAFAEVDLTVQIPTTAKSAQLYETATNNTSSVYMRSSRGSDNGVTAYQAIGGQYYLMGWFDITGGSSYACSVDQKCGEAAAIGVSAFKIAR